MPTSFAQSITEDVCNVLISSAASLSLPFTVKRHYLPRYDAGEDVPKQAPFVVHVVPSGVESVDFSRDIYTQANYAIDVAVLGHVGENQREQKVDAFLLLVEEIQNLLAKPDNSQLVTSTADLAMPAYTQDTIYDPAALRDYRVFFSVTTFNYRVTRGG